MLKSYGGDKALRASTFSAFVNVVDEACRMRLDTRKVHLGTAFYAVYVSVQPLRPALTVSHCSIMKVAARQMISQLQKCATD